jgi:hypothetical protein
VLYVSNGHPAVLERLAPSPADEQQVRAAMRRLREAKQMQVNSPAGYVTRIESQTLDAELMREYFAAWGDREAYAVSHVGWGMNPRARWDALVADGGRGSILAVAVGPGFADNRHRRTKNKCRSPTVSTTPHWCSRPPAGWTTTTARLFARNSRRI